MPWPAPDLPINFQNATVSLDTHPQAHNATNLSLNNDYRPELSRVGSSLAATQSVYQGNDDAGSSVIWAATGIRLRTDADVIIQSVDGTSRGRVPALFFAGRTGGSLTGFTTGATPVATSRTLDFTGTFPRGGYIQARYSVRFTHNTSNGIGFIYPGWNTGGGIQFATATYTVGAVVVSGTDQWVETTYTVTIPTGAVNPQLVLGVADGGNVGGVGIVSGSLQGDVWSY